MLEGDGGFDPLPSSYLILTLDNRRFVQNHITSFPDGTSDH